MGARSDSVIAIDQQSEALGRMLDDSIDGSGLRPRARAGLRTTEHVRRGRRLISVLDTETLEVSVLDPWEHAVLLLCDGHRTAVEIASLLSGAETEVDLRGVLSCFRLFGREGLTEAGFGDEEQVRPPRAKTKAGLAAAYLEWHKESEPVDAKPVAPFVDDDSRPNPDLKQTVALAEEAEGVAIGASLLDDDEATVVVRAVLPR